MSIIERKSDSIVINVYLGEYFDYNGKCCYRLCLYKAIEPLCLSDNKKYTLIGAYRISSATKILSLKVKDYIIRQMNDIKLNLHLNVESRYQYDSYSKAMKASECSTLKDATYRDLLSRVSFQFFENKYSIYIGYR